jgi:hypothetical protein
VKPRNRKTIIAIPQSTGKQPGTGTSAKIGKAYGILRSTRTFPSERPSRVGYAISNGAEGKAPPRINWGCEHRLAQRPETSPPLSAGVTILMEKKSPNEHGKSCTAPGATDALGKTFHSFGRRTSRSFGKSFHSPGADHHAHCPSSGFSRQRRTRPGRIRRACAQASRKAVAFLPCR